MFKTHVNFKDAMSCYQHLAEIKKDNQEELLLLKSNFLMYAKMRYEAHKDPEVHTWLQSMEDKIHSAHIEQQTHVTATAAKTRSREDAMSLALSIIDSMVGLNEAKKQIEAFTDYAKMYQIRKDAGLYPSPISLHMAFFGNPGTGKTTVARCMAMILYGMGLIETEKIVEVDRTDLIGSKIGHTEEKTNDIFVSATGGVLFIDEAHTLLQPECSLDYGRECVNILMKLMEDYREKVVVIFAGYEEEMNKSILVHKGMKSRVQHHIRFSDYTPEEGIDIFRRMCDLYDYVPEKPALAKIEAYLKGVNKDGLGHFANGRDIRNIFEKSLIRQAQRIAGLGNPEEHLKELKMEDIDLPVTSKNKSIIYLKS